jgi:V/A-type H+-transporting ATPase subunit A
MALLQEESELEEIVQLVGMDALSAADRLKLEAARSIREDFLHQDAFHEVDTYSPLEKQYTMIEMMLAYYDICREALDQGVSINALVKLPVREAIGRFKYIPLDQVQTEYETIIRQLNEQIDALILKLKEENL